MASAISRGLDRARVPVLFVLIGALIWTAGVAARAKPFWHDEIYTILVSQLPSISTIWAAEQDGIDLQPPLNTLATRVVCRWLGHGPVAVRLPALIGFSTMTVIVFVLVRARAGATLALAGALVPIQTAAFRYAYEARGYAMVLALLAIALLAWTNAAKGRRRGLWIPTLTIALASATWAHYYAGLVFAILGLAEVARQAAGRRVDWPMWLAFSLAAAMVLPLTPLILGASTQRQGFWAPAAGTSVAATYSFLFQPLVTELWSWRGAAVAAALLLSAASARLISAPTPDTACDVNRSAPVPLHEVLAFTGLLLMPLGLLVVGRTIAGAFTARYALGAVIGLAVLLPLIVRWFARRESLAEALLCAMLAVPFVHTAGAAVTAAPPAPPNPFEERQLLRASLTREQVVVVSGSLTFLQLWYYAPPPLKSRLVYLADSARAIQITGTDTFDRGYLTLARWTGVPAEQYARFISQHHEFTVYQSGSGWLLPALEARGAIISLIASEAAGQQYRVTVPSE